MATISTVTCPPLRPPGQMVGGFAYRPFCLGALQADDLGAWATEKYKVPDQGGGRTMSKTDCIRANREDER